MSTESLAQTPQIVSEFLENHDGWVSNEFEQKARERARRAEMEQPINRAPTTIAAASIYLTGLLVNEKLTQREITAASGVSDQAIRNCYVEIAEHEGIPLAHNQDDDDDKQAKGVFTRAVNAVIRR